MSILNDGVGILKSTGKAKGKGKAPASQGRKTSPEDFDLDEATVNQVKTYVNANPDTIDDLLTAEAAGKNRVTLIEWLTEKKTEPPAGAGAEDTTSEENQS